MLTQHNSRRGRPKGHHDPASAKSRVTKFRQNLKDSGGVTVTLNLDAFEVGQLEKFREYLQLPSKTSRSELIKGMTCVLGGGVYITKGHQITATLIATERMDHPEWLLNIYHVQ